MKLLNDLFSLLHNIQVRLVHIIGLKQVLGVEPLLDQSPDLLIQEVSFKLQRRDELLHLYDVSS